MKRLAVIALSLAFAAVCFLPVAKADTLTSVLFNVNGATQTNFTGFNTGGFDQTTGNGTLTYTFTAAAGTYSFTAFFDHYLTAPLYNEFGSASASPPATGQSWEIGDSFASSIYNDATAGVLTNTNMLPGQADNYLLSCIGTNCNGDASMAMGFLFTLAANQSELITLTLSHTQPGSGFYLTQTHPIDPGNPLSVLNLYFTGSAVAQTATIPEPGTLTLLACGFVALVLKRRASK